MIRHVFVAQPRDGVGYTRLFAEACALAGFGEFRAAVAYATTSGVALLRAALEAAQPAIITTSIKRWLVGIDWCRSEPAALEMLSAMPASEVRIPFGEDVIKRIGCNPIVPFHAKSYLMSGGTTKVLILGSGNLSRSGLSRGHEWGSLAAVSNPTSATEQELEQQIAQMEEWFEELWALSPRYSKIRRKYIEEYESADHLANPVPTDDDVSSTAQGARTGAGRRVRPEFLRQLRAAARLWIQAGNLHENRGPGRPGNQLMLTPMSRVFFGFEASDVPTDTLLGNVSLKYKAVVRPDCSMRFSNNGMDVLTLPVPGHGGPSKYDQETILFTRLPTHGFKLQLGSSRQVREWRSRSRTVDGFFTMTSGRKWGVF